MKGIKKTPSEQLSEFPNKMLNSCEIQGGLSKEQLQEEQAPGEAAESPADTSLTARQQGLHPSRAEGAEHPGDTRQDQQN